MKALEQWRAFRNSPRYEDRKGALIKKSKNLLMTILQIILIVGISYVILSPVIGIVAQSFFSDADSANPMVFTIPMSPTWERYEGALQELHYLPTFTFHSFNPIEILKSFWAGLTSSTLFNTLLYTIVNTVFQVVICSMVGYGFARFEFPFKKLLFGCVVVMIVVPSHTIMLPQYMTFRSMELMRDMTPMFILSIFGVGLRSGLYVYIFNQFFRGLPKEIEEAAFVDGAGTWYTYFRIMLVNAIPAVITVTVFSLVWQYNDMFYAKLFQIPNSQLLARQLSTLQSNIGANLKIMNVRIQKLYVNAGVVLVMLPILLIYLMLQKRFVEGVERSGIVG
ncbi:MAG: carbohydrate ABC transporter permease [Clostridia bacterium]|nr:carbohydrate ABC transporter permease [Clostridia bacterium]